ncbi:kinase-like domain-containing protein [Hyaloraphidium curvatum]|nr:kinase-like domain-containing protein [Hyaloraphidium curvatum]
MAAYSALLGAWFTACRTGNRATVNDFLRQPTFDANVREQASGLTGLHLSCEADDAQFSRELVDRLASRQNAERILGATTPTGDTAILLAYKHGYIEALVGMLDATQESLGLNRADIDGMTMWLLACRDGAVELVDKLLCRYEGYIDFNAVEERSGKSGLSLACCFGHSDVIDSIVNHPEMSAENAPRLNLTDNDGRTPFFYLCQREGSLPERDAQRFRILIHQFLRIHERTDPYRPDSSGIVPYVLCSPTGSAIIAKYRTYFGIGAEHYRIALKDVVYVATASNQLGGGGHSKVYKGTYRGESVAVKVIPINKRNGPDIERHHRNLIEKEVNILASLLQRDNVNEPGYANLFPLIGYVPLDSEWLVVSPMVPKIKGCSPDLHSWLWFSRKSGTYLTDALRLLHGFALAVSFLHRRGIIHGDIKAGNCLVSGDRAMLIDFGMARVTDNISLRTSGARFRGGTVSHLAPELARSGNGRTTVKSDVFAFSMVAFEIVSGAYEIWPDLSRETQVHPNVRAHPTCWCGSYCGSLADFIHRPGAYRTHGR